MESPYARSPELMLATDTVLVVVDVQEKLLPHIFNSDQVESNVGRLIQGAKQTGIPVLCTEQYPKGLGPTVNSLAVQVETTLEKLTFSCAGKDLFLQELVKLKRRKVLLCGIETHVCVQQTALDLLAAGYAVYLPLDGIGARRQFDHEVAIRRLESSGVSVCSTEACLFEWCAEAGTELFTKLRALIT